MTNGSGDHSPKREKDEARKKVKGKNPKASLKPKGVPPSLRAKPE
jgi:hypothetical protein